MAIEERTEEATGATHELELAPHSFTIVAIGDGSEEPPVDPDPEPEPEPTVYTIKLMLDGELHKTIDVVDGELSEELPVLTREGWVFEGWFYEDGTAFDSSRPIEGDLVLSAKWTKASTPDEPSEKTDRPQTHAKARAEAPGRPAPNGRCLDADGCRWRGCRCRNDNSRRTCSQASRLVKKDPSIEGGSFASRST